MGSELQQTEDAMAERRRLFHENASVTSEEKLGKLSEIYGEWFADNKYDKNMITLGYVGHKRLADLVSRYIPEKSSLLLDVGCGTGLLGQELKGRGYLTLHGLDASEESLEISQKKGVYNTFYSELLGPNRLPISDDTYDGVCFSAVFGSMHVGFDCFPELIRITKPGGYIIFDTYEYGLTRCELYGNGKLDGALHKMADEGRFEYLEKRRNVYYTTKPDGKAEYCYAFVLKVI